MDKISGIYCIENVINNKKYIGKSVNIYKRWREHKRELKNKTHKNKHLQRAYDLYGSDNFCFYIIEICESDDIALKEKEIVYIQFYKTNEIESGYNLTNGGDGISGYKHSKETCRKLSLSHMGKPAHNKGVPASEESKEKNRLAHTGLKGTPEKSEKLSRSLKGKIRSEESKQRYSESKMGDKNPSFGKVPENITREKLSNSHIGKKKGIPCTSKYVGVCRPKDRKRWVATISYMGKGIYIGTYITEKEAAIAYNNKALELFGNNAILNIIDDAESEV